MTAPCTLPRSGAFFVLSMLTTIFPGVAQDTATPVAKVTTMLEDMQVKSEKLKKEADEIYVKVKSSCETTIQTKKDEVTSLDLEIEKLDAEVKQLTTDIADLVTNINDDNHGHEMDSKELDDLRKTRMTEEASYKRDLSEYDVAISAVDRAVLIMKKQGSASSFMQVGRSAEAQSAIEQVAHSLRQLSVYTPEGGGLAKDEKIFDEFNTLSTNSGAYKAGSKEGSGGVAGVLEGLKATFDKAKTELMDKEKTDKEAYTTKEANLVKQLETARETLTTNKGTKAQKEELTTLTKGELNQATITKASTAKFLAKTEVVCEQKKTSYEEMTKLRTNEITALTKAVEIIKGTVTTNANSLNEKAGAFTQILVRARPSENAAQHFVDSLDAFINKQAGKLHSHSLVLLGDRVKVLATQAPNEALAKVKTMIEELILKMQQDGAAEATQKAWCDDELAKNEKEQKLATTAIETHTASVKKIESDIKMLNQEVTLLGQEVTNNKEEKTSLETARTTEKADNEKTIKEAKESTAAVEAAITVLTEYYKEASKATALLANRHNHVSKKQTPNEVPADIAAKDAEGPQVTEGGNVIAMLEVVRDSYGTLITKTEAAEAKAVESYNQQMTDTEVMITAGEAQVKNKGELIADDEKMLPLKEADLKASNTALTDAEANYDNLKAPCLNGNAAEERKAQVEAEIAALKEALTMLEAYKGTFLLQESKHQALSEQAVSRVPASTEQIEKVAVLLQGIKTDVEKDLAADTAAYDDMSKWCTATISETQASLKTQKDRDAELVTAIEVSTQQKTILATQLENLKSETGKYTNSLNTMASLRTGDMESFQKSEKETMVAISALRSAISVLRAKYDSFDKADKRDFKAEQEAIKPATTLVGLANNVAKALKLLPVNEFNMAVNGETGAILQGFLSRPDDFMQAGSKHAGLITTGSQVVSSGTDGKAILGILETLMETFTADLKAMQDREKAGIETYASTKSAKESQISAMDASIATKESQLAHYTTMNAQAKEDLAYLRETNLQDIQYLRDVTDQCSTSENEFKARKKTREDEIAALAEGISILTAGTGVTNSSPATTVPAQTSSMIHTDRRVTRKVFVHKHDSSKKRPVLKVATATKPKTVTLKQSPAKAKAVVTASKVSKSFVQAVSGGSPLHRSLAALSAQVKLVHRQLSMGPLTSGAIKSVVTQIDVVVVQLQTQKKLEIQKSETCVKEKNDATEQRQRRVTDKSKLDNTIATLTTDIKSATDDMEALAQQVDELKLSITDANKARQEAHDEYKASVQDQLNQQKVLHNAIAALKKFYAGKTALVQKISPVQPLQSLLDGLEQQLRNAGQEVTERHLESTGELAKQSAVYDALARDPKTKTICETGFNAGHSALRLLAQSNATLFEFDLGVHPYGKIGAAFLMDKFPNRMHTLWGDSAVVMPLFHWQRPDVKCDLMSVDGGKSYEVAMADLTNFAKMASPSHTVVMDDTPCSSELCAGPTRAWQELVQNGCIVQTQAAAMGTDRGFSVGRFTPCNFTFPQHNQPASQPTHAGLPALAAGLPGVKLVGAAKTELPAQAVPVKLVAHGHAADPVVNQTKEQQALDDGIEKNMDMKRVDVKDVAAKRVEKPKGFDKPLKSHTGTTGIIGILQIIVQDSESLIEREVKDEQSELDLHLKNIQNIEDGIASKERESTMLEQTKADNELKKTQNMEQLKAVETEITQIEEFVEIVDKQCKTFLADFEANQAARAAEISDTIQAKEVLLGMAESGDAASALTQLARTAQHAVQHEQ